MNDDFSVSFAGNDINAISGAEIYNHNFNNLPSRDIKINKLARQDLSIITSSEYSAKNITVNVKVNGGTERSATEDVIRVLKSRVQAQNSSLVVSQSGIKVEYTATMNEFEINWISNATALVTINFIASDPIGRGMTIENLAILTGQTSGLSAIPITVGGSSAAKTSITIVVQSVTGGTGAFIQLLNGATNQGIKITRNWSNGDTLIVDSANMQVTVNGVLTDFSGIFPMFNTGAQQIKYNDSFTTRTYDMSVTYKPRLA